MSPTKMAPATVWKAIEVYLRFAYGQSALPGMVEMRICALRSLSDDKFYECKALERDGMEPPTRYSLRLGNSFYPHMKLTIEVRPDHCGFLFHADTHDRHCCPSPDSAEYPLFRDLMDRNRKMGQAIEAAWAAEGLPTFKTYLRSDLLRRQASAASSSSMPIAASIADNGFSRDNNTGTGK